MTNQDATVDDGDLIDERDDAVRVHITGTDIKTQNLAADFGSWNTYQVTGAAGEAPVQILPQNVRRNTARITIQPGTDNNSSGQVILAATQAAASQRQGAFYLAGQTVTVESTGSVYAIGDNNGSHLQIVVHDELYRAVE